MLILFIHRLLVINKKGRKRPLDTPERKIERRYTAVSKILHKHISTRLKL